MTVPDNFLLICDGASGDRAAEVRMASYLTEMFNGWKIARRKDREGWSTISSAGGSWTWTPDGRLTVKEPRNKPEEPPP